ncbi:hypothetical protein [Azonexus hydrophilus]|uniref:Uncharacterized protein n=1 Tax=Azonexus hydrophilus TaxID=418702 RepID=A0ABZ2XQ10_9RHOO
MKQSEIQAGECYFDGKEGIREVVSIDPKIPTVKYRLLSAKITQEYSWTKGQMVSLIGSETTCNLSSFASWAKHHVPQAEIGNIMLRIAAKKIKLAPGEKMFMNSALDESGGAIVEGTSISFDHTEGRAVSGLEKKGLLVRDNREVTVTALGAAWFANAAEARIADMKG